MPSGRPIVTLSERRGDVERLGFTGFVPPSFFGGRLLRTFMVSVSGSGTEFNFLTCGLAGDGDGVTKSNDEILAGFENNGDSVGAFAGANNTSLSIESLLILRRSFLDFTSSCNADFLSFDS